MAKISIVTINYNNREGLQKTIESVASQTNRTFEYIVVDGGSTDGSAEIIKDNCHFIDKWVSEPDKGIYNAMNKGVQMSSGEYCLFLNSGDLLHDNNVFERLSKHKFYKDIYFGEVIGTNDGKANKWGKYSLNEEITLLTIYEGHFHHAGSFIKRELMIKYPYREDLKICSDRQFFIQSIIIDNCSYGSIKTPVCLFDMGGGKPYIRCLTKSGKQPNNDRFIPGKSFQGLSENKLPTSESHQRIGSISKPNDKNNL